MLSHADEESPRECCGLLSGLNGHIERHHPLENVDRRPEKRYFADPKALFAAMVQIREAGMELLGIYHSHPRSSPFPSPTDVREAFYPECAYFIVGREGSDPRVKAFRLEGSRVEEIRFTSMEGRGVFSSGGSP